MSSNRSQRPSNSLKGQDQAELLGMVEDRECKTRGFLYKQHSGSVEKTILQIAVLLHISERKAKEYYNKEWAQGNIGFTKTGTCWEWTGSEDMERRFNSETMRYEFRPKEDDENATEYIQRRQAEKLEELRKKLKTEVNKNGFS